MRTLRNWENKQINFIRRSFTWTLDAWDLVPLLWEFLLVLRLSAECWLNVDTTLQLCQETSAKLSATTWCWYVFCVLITQFYRFYAETLNTLGDSSVVCVWLCYRFKHTHTHIPRPCETEHTAHYTHAGKRMYARQPNGSYTKQTKCWKRKHVFSSIHATRVAHTKQIRMKFFSYFSHSFEWFYTLAARISLSALRDERIFRFECKYFVSLVQCWLRRRPNHNARPLAAHTFEFLNLRKTDSRFGIRNSIQMDMPLQRQIVVIVKLFYFWT